MSSKRVVPHKILEISNAVERFKLFNLLIFSSGPEDYRSSVSWHHVCFASATVGVLAA